MTRLSQAMGATNRAKNRRHVLAISLADLARAAGIGRSSVTRLSQRRLRHARLPDGRIDAGHSEVEKWAIERGTDPIALLPAIQRPRPVIIIDRGALPPEELSALLRIRQSELGDLERVALTARTQRDAGHVDAEEVAFLAGVRSSDVVRAVHGGTLAPALLPNGLIDLGHQAVLAFMAARPYETDAEGSPVGCDGHLEPAVVGGEVDTSHPAARCYYARAWGRIPVDADFKLPAEAR